MTNKWRYDTFDIAIKREFNRRISLNLPFFKEKQFSWIPVMKMKNIAQWEVVIEYKNDFSNFI